MNSFMRRFVLVAVLGSMFCGIMLAGCGGGSEETPAANAPSKAKDKTPDDPK